MSKVRWVGLSALCALLLVGLAGPAGAQTGTTATVVGKVTDEKGEPAVGAEVVLRSLGSSRECKTKTDKTGEYSCAGLQPGRYQLSVKYKSFGGKVEREVKGGESGNPDSPSFQNRFDVNLGGEEAAQRQQEAFKKIKAGYEQAVALNKEGKYEEALTEMQPVAEKEPKQWPVHWQMAVSYIGLNRNEEAEASLKKAIALNPTNAGLYNELGRLYMKLKRLDEARTQFETAANLSPEEAPIFWYNMGVTYYNAGDLKAAIEPFEKAVELDPGHAQAHYYLGVCLFSTAESKVEEGQVKMILAPGTREHFETYLALAPTGPLAQQAKDYLQAIDAVVPAAVRSRKK